MEKEDLTGGGGGEKKEKPPDEIRCEVEEDSGSLKTAR